MFTKASSSQNPIHSILPSLIWFPSSPCPLHFWHTSSSSTSPHSSSPYVQTISAYPLYLYQPHSYCNNSFFRHLTMLDQTSSRYRHIISNIFTLAPRTPSLASMFLFTRRVNSSRRSHWAPPGGGQAASGEVVS